MACSPRPSRATHSKGLATGPTVRPTHTPEFALSEDPASDEVSESRSPTVPPAEHHGRGQQHDLQGLERRAAVHVFKIVAQLLPHILHAGTVRLVALGPPGHPRENLFAQCACLELGS